MHAFFMNAALISITRFFQTLNNQNSILLKAYAVLNKLTAFLFIKLMYAYWNNTIPFFNFTDTRSYLIPDLWSFSKIERVLQRCKAFLWSSWTGKHFIHLCFTCSYVIHIKCTLFFMPYFKTLRFEARLYICPPHPLRFIETLV